MKRSKEHWSKKPSIGVGVVLASMVLWPGSLWLTISAWMLLAGCAIVALASFVDSFNVKTTQEEIDEIKQGMETLRRASRL